DDGIRTDGDGEGDDRRDGEARRLAELADAEPYVAQEGLEAAAGDGVARLILVTRHSTEFDPRLAFGGVGRESVALQIVGAELFVQLGLESAAAQKPVAERAEIGGEPHATSGRAVSANPIAAASRFHPSISAWSCFLPAAVSS